jgi:hypothetical protein
MDDLFERALAAATGPMGGLVMVSFGGGVWVAMKFLAPKIYLPQIRAVEVSCEAQIEALKGQIDALKQAFSRQEEELAPYREWAASSLPKATTARRYKGTDK